MARPASFEIKGVSYIPRRWVEDGKLVTAAGTSGGIDMALHLVAQRKGERTARRVQLWIEYDPQPPFGPMAQPAAEDDETLASLLARHQADWERSLAKRPDLLAAVRRAASSRAAATNVSCASPLSCNATTSNWTVSRRGTRLTPRSRSLIARALSPAARLALLATYRQTRDGA